MKRRGAFTLIELLVVLSIIAILIALLLPAVYLARQAARRASCINNLKQLDLALQTYVTTYNVLPSGSYNASGPILSVPEGYQVSWIVSLLPYMEQQGVYRALDLRVGVHAPENKTARVTRMRTLLCPEDLSGENFDYSEPGRTSYAGCHHDIEGPIDVGNHGVLFLNSRVCVADVADGLSQTIFLGEVPRASRLGWITGTRATLRNTGHPINRVDRSALGNANIAGPASGRDRSLVEIEAMIESGRLVPPPTFVGGFGSIHPSGGANFALGDGSVRFLKDTVDPWVYRRLGHRADGEMIDDDAL